METRTVEDADAPCECVASRTERASHLRGRSAPGELSLLPWPCMHRYVVEGCTDPKHTLNYDSVATVLSGCVYVNKGCTDSSSPDYVRDANVDDGTCQYPIYGCVDKTALNYDSTATLLKPGSCILPIGGCADSTAANYAPDVNVPTNSVCKFDILGCVFAGASNFDSTATKQGDTGELRRASPEN